MLQAFVRFTIQTAGIRKPAGAASMPASLTNVTSQIITCHPNIITGIPGFLRPPVCHKSSHMNSQTKRRGKTYVPPQFSNQDQTGSHCRIWPIQTR